MNTQDFQKACDDLSALMCEHGFIRPTARLSFASNEVPYVHLSWADPEGNVYNSDTYKFLRSDTIEDAIGDAFVWVRDQPSAEEKAKADALALTAKALEASRAAGLEPEFLNPLEAMMKKLSENVITDQSNDASK